MLRGLDIDVGENNDIVLGIFDPSSAKFVNTTPERFINDFLMVSLLKGHFQGNKGYQLEVLPQHSLELGPLDGADGAQPVPERVSVQRGKREVPLGLRYRILVRDESRCCRCGRGPTDGVKLHVDHRTPYSLGGRTEFSNLWTLCGECNLGKGNRHID